MKKRLTSLAAASLMLLTCSLPAYAADADPAKSELKGMIAITDEVPPVYVYEKKDGSLFQSTEKIGHVRDIRPFRKKHPKAFAKLIKVRNFCKTWEPIITPVISLIGLGLTVL